MITFFNLILYLFMSCLLAASPPKEIPADLYEEYTMYLQVPVRPYYLDNSYSASQGIIYSTEEINQYIDKVTRREVGYYGTTDLFLYSLLDKYPWCIKDKCVGIIGSTIPWYESIIIAYGGHPITIEYNKIVREDARLKIMTVEEFDQNPIQFDTLLSISSIEHDGLGRYGDPIDPHGDIKAMHKMKTMLKEGGLLILAVPVGKDTLFWNAHRIYGQMRLPLLLKEWEVVDSCGFSETDFTWENYGEHQPVFVLKSLRER